MKNKKILIISGVTVLSMVVGGFIASQSMNHQMKNTDLSAHVGAHNVSNIDTVKESTDISKVTENSTPQGNNVSNDDKASSSELQDIEFVQYTVKENDTLWRIAKTYMPSYNAYPEDGKAGVIDYIVKENKLGKAADGKFVIYSGQKLTIPKQREIALNTSKSTAVSNNKITSTEKTAQVNNAASIPNSNTSNAANEKPTSNTSNNTVQDSGSSEDNIDHSNHVDHSSH